MSFLYKLRYRLHNWCHPPLKKPQHRNTDAYNHPTTSSNHTTNHHLNKARPRLHGIPRPPHPKPPHLLPLHALNNHIHTHTHHNSPLKTPADDIHKHTTTGHKHTTFTFTASIVLKWASKRKNGGRTQEYFQESWQRKLEEEYVHMVLETGNNWRVVS